MEKSSWPVVDFFYDIFLKKLLPFMTGISKEGKINFHQ